MTTQTYQDAALHLLQQAETELAAGDIRQASEKAWGAAAQAVKAAATIRGWPHEGHHLLFDVIHSLEDETGDTNLEALFAVAHQLHVNFYENVLSERLVGQELIAVRRLVNRLAELQPQEARR